MSARFLPANLRNLYSLAEGEPCPICTLVQGYCGGLSSHPSCGCFIREAPASLFDTEVADRYPVIVYQEVGGRSWVVTYRSRAHHRAWNAELEAAMEGGKHEFMGHWARLSALAWRDMACPPLKRGREGEIMPLDGGREDRMVPAGLIRLWREQGWERGWVRSL